MAIAKRKPDAPAINPPVLPYTQEETYKGIVADNRSEPLIQMQAYLEGMPWSVTWYGQLLGQHNDVRELDPTQSDAYQQYQKTIDLELRVTSAINPSYDSQEGMMTVTGSANVPILVPNRHDYFVAEAGSRHLGLYRVTNVERATFNRMSVYRVDYALVGHIEDSATYQALEAKVVRTYRFVKDRLIEGISPILREEIFALTKDIQERRLQLERQYFKAFTDPRYLTLVVPEQLPSIYDTWLVDFVLQIIDTMQIPELRDFKRVSVDRDRFLAKGQLWSLLLERDYDMLSHVVKKAGLVSRYYFNKSSWIKTAAYWPIDRYVFPIFDGNQGVVGGKEAPDVSAMTLSSTQSVESLMATHQFEQETVVLPLIKPVLIDDYYVLSAAFYENRPEELSHLEIQVRDYLKHQTLNLTILHELVKAYRTWPALEQFYYGPILMLLLKECVKGLYV